MVLRIAMKSARVQNFFDIENYIFMLPIKIYAHISDSCKITGNLNTMTKLNFMKHTSFKRYFAVPTEEPIKH